MIHRIQRFFQWLVAGSFTLVISACYGTMMDDLYDNYTLSKDVRLIDVENLPIEGLEVSLIDEQTNTNQSRYTDTNGYVYFSITLDKSYYYEALPDFMISVRDTNTPSIYQPTNIAYTNLSNYEITVIRQTNQK